MKVYIRFSSGPTKNVIILVVTGEIPHPTYKKPVNMGQTESETPKCHHWKTPRSRDDYVNTAFVDWVQKLWQISLENPKIA